MGVEVVEQNHVETKIVSRKTFGRNQKVVEILIFVVFS